MARLAAIRREGLPATVGATSPVAAPSRGERRIETQAAQTVAERAMDKGLNFHPRLAANLRRLLQPQFTCRHHAHESQFLQCPRPGGRGAGQLRRGMERQTREGPPYPCGQTQVLHNHAIYGHLVQQRQGIGQLRQFPRLQQRV